MPPPPLLTAHLFPELDGQLVALLSSLAPADWRRPTIVPGWTVRDVAAHLLDTALRRLSIARDGWAPPVPALATPADLITWVNETNARGVAVHGQHSPPVLLALTRVAVAELHAYLAGLEPFAPAVWPVSWAGETASAAWFDVARELTERWHHQQQIRLALDRPGIMTPRLYGPVLATFMRGLPHAYRDLESPAGTRVRIVVSGDCGSEWVIVRGQTGWALQDPIEPGPAAATCILPQDLAWRVFTRGIAADEARERCRLEGDPRLAGGVLRMLAIVG
jgi:uncharacterized protein (TIGR03083 family)